MTELEDLSPMPWGAHKGKPMQDVPASYFHYLWIHGKDKDTHCPVHHYIKNNMSALKKDHPDGIWS